MRISPNHGGARAVRPELDNAIVNLEFLPLTLNQAKAAKVGDRQVAMDRKFHEAGLINAAALAVWIGGAPRVRLRVAQP